MLFFKYYNFGYIIMFIIQIILSNLMLTLMLILSKLALAKLQTRVLLKNS